MTDRKTRLVVVAALALALAGGLAAGTLAARFSKSPALPAASVESLSLSAELKLSPAQSEKIRPIWENMRGDLNDCYKRAQAVDQQRQEALLKLLTPEQREHYAHINQDYADRYTAVTAKRQALFDQAIARTKTLLTEQQKQQYEAILLQRLNHGPVSGDGLNGDRSTRLPPTASS